MEARWDIAAVIVAILAIPFAMSPTAAGLVTTAFLFLVRQIWPATAQCERLAWMDIPEGVLHECTVPVENCGVLNSEIGNGPETPITRLFTRIRRDTFVLKPKALDWRTDYVRTDATTLKALWLFTAGPSYVPVSERNIRLYFKRVGTLMTVHIYISHDYHPMYLSIEEPCRNISKADTKLLLQGYPPWYRESLLLANGSIIGHPITSFEDLSRGGWITAVGLSATLPFHNHCMSVDLYGKMEEPLSPFSRALDRIIWRLSNLEEVFPSEATYINEAYSLVTFLRFKVNTRSMITYPFYESKFRALFNDKYWFDHDLDPERRRSFARGISSEEALLMIRVFNDYRKLTDEEIRALEPILLITLRVVLVGSFEAVYHLYENKATEIPPELDEFQTFYLRHRYEDEDP